MNLLMLTQITTLNGVQISPNWSELLQEGQFSEGFLRKYLNDILKQAATSLCRYQKLSPEFMRSIWNSVDPDLLCFYQDNVPSDLIQAHYEDLIPGYQELFVEELGKHRPEYLCYINV